MNTITYTRKDIVRRVADNLGLGDKEVKLIMDEILDAISGMFIENHPLVRMELRNFGVFEIKPAKAKPRARNPKTNEEVYVPPHRKIHFKPGKKIKLELKKEFHPNS